MKTWMTEWPLEPGRYWFYGKCYKQETEDRLYFVKVIRMGGGSNAYVTDGHFMYRSEGAQGAWQPVELPDLPGSGTLSLVVE